MRKTKIICSIGPKTDSLEMLEKLSKSGMNMARLNMSHSNQEYYEKVIRNIKKMNEKSEFPVSIMVDTQGPEIRIGELPKDMDLEEGDILKLVVNPEKVEEEKDEKSVHVNYKGMIKDVYKDDVILIDDGKIALKALKFNNHYIKCKVMNKGRISSRKCVNLPGVKIDIPSITKKDEEDIDFAVRNNADFIALSFVRHRDDIIRVKDMIREKGSDMNVIAKIENMEAIKNLDYIIEVSDAVMVARGDLGVEVPLEEVPVLQKKIIAKCINLGKPVIIATHLLETMIDNPRPTRAEVTDVANAVFEGADGIMLSGETTIGKYPIECVKTFDRISRRIEKEVTPNFLSGKVKNVKEEIAKEACVTAVNLKAKAIVVFTTTCRLPKLVAKHRPNSNIYVFTESESLQRKLMILWGCLVFKHEFEKDYYSMVRKAIDKLKEKKFIEQNNLVIIVSNIEKNKDMDTLEVLHVK